MPITPIEAFAVQASYCETNEAPITAAICRALMTALDRSTETGRTVLDWPGHPVKDGMVLRLVGGVHAAWRRGQVPELAPLFAKEPLADGIMARFVAAHDEELLPWLDGPPQTNEPGRAATLMLGLMEIARRHGPKLELLEIGSSAGLNLSIAQFRIDLGGVVIGPDESILRLTPEWRGPPPAPVTVDIVSARGVDIAPMDATDPKSAERLLSYAWADHPQRVGRIEAVIQMQRERPVQLEQGDAADWIDSARLAEPQADGVTRVLMHSIVWQYLGDERQARITAAMERAGATATLERPLGWVRLEADRTLNRHDMTVRSWPGHADEVLLGHGHAHGFWVERIASDG